MSEHDAPDPDLATLQAAGDAPEAVLGEVFERHRRRLLHMIHVRMDPRLHARAGASDVIQEAWLEASDRIAAYLADPRMPFFLWLRVITHQRLIRLQRAHLGAQKRDVRRQVGIHADERASASVVALADELMARHTAPDEAAVRGEIRAYLTDAIGSMKEEDREVLSLRHFEELSNVEAAAELGIEPAAASKRYMRALQRLQAILGETGLGDAKPG